MRITFKQNPYGKTNMIVTDAIPLFRNLTGIDHTNYPNPFLKTFTLDIPSQYVEELRSRGYKLRLSHNPNDPQHEQYLLDVRIAFKMTKDDPYNPKVTAHTDDGDIKLDVDSINKYQHENLEKINFVASEPWSKDPNAGGGACYANIVDIYVEGSPYKSNYEIENSPDQVFF